MAKHYRLPSIAIQFAESGSVADNIQLFRVGKFHHDAYGVFEITEKMLAEIKHNFEKRVRGIDIAVDYKHASEDIAAGWIKSLDIKDGRELWAAVEWTPAARKVLSDKEFRYISPDFTFDYKDNETLTKHGPVLLGAGLTNRPVIKKMEPAVELMEGDKAVPETLEERKHMTEQEIKKLQDDLKLAETRASEAEIKATEVEKKVAELEAGKQLAEKKSVFAKLLAEGKVCAAQEQSYLDGDMVKFAELAKPVKLAEVGSGAKPEGEAKEEGKDLDVEEQVLALAEKHMTEKQSKKDAKGFSDAINHVLNENKELAKRYNEKFDR